MTVSREGVGTHLVDLITEQARRTPDAVALRSTRVGRRGRLRTADVTYAELAQRVESTASSLTDRGLRPGDRVLFSIRPRIEGIVLVLGIVRARGVVVFVDPGSTPELFTARLAAASPTWAATEALLHAVSRGPLRRVARARGLLLPGYARLPVQHVYSGRWLPGVPRGAERARRLADGPAGVLPALDAADHALIVFTSGTTEAPRAVVHSAGSLGAGTELLGGVNALATGDVVHTDQMLLGIPALLAGATWSVPQDAPARDIAGFARQATDAACAFLVPADVTALLDAVEAGEIAPSGPRVVLVGGAPVTRALLERAVSLLPRTRWVAVYGMTEILPVAVVEAREKLAFTGEGDLVGRPLPGITARIDRSGADRRDDDAGELVLGGPSLMAGYLADLRADAGHDAGDTAGAREHRSGDLAYLDDDGRIVLAGRTRDMIIRGTVNIYPGLFEPRIAALDGVGEAVLVGVQEPDGDERVVLVVTLQGRSRGTGGAGPVALTDRHPLLDALARELPTVLDHGALPDEVLLADRLPTSGRSQKPDRRALARAVTARPGEEPRPS